MKPTPPYRTENAGYFCVAAARTAAQISMHTQAHTHTHTHTCTARKCARTPMHSLAWDCRTQAAHACSATAAAAVANPTHITHSLGSAMWHIAHAQEASRHTSQHPVQGNAGCHSAHKQGHAASCADASDGLLRLKHACWSISLHVLKLQVMHTACAMALSV